MNAGESVQARWGQWWRLAAGQARLRRDIEQLRTRVDLLEVRVDGIEAQMHECAGGAA